MQIRKILCPVDFSEPAREALHFAVDFARRFDAQVTLLHVFVVPGYAYPEGIVLAGPEVMNEILERIDRALREWRDEAISRAGGALRIDVESRQGTPWAEIVRKAEEDGYDLVVIGTHGRSGLSHALLGSVAERVVRKAPCPVLTVRAAHHPKHAAAPAPPPPPTGA